MTLPGGANTNASEPIWRCGEDFCELCGDCLWCYGGDPCALNDDMEHMYADPGEERCYSLSMWREADGVRVLTKSPLRDEN